MATLGCTEHDTQAKKITYQNLNDCVVRLEALIQISCNDHVNHAALADAAFEIMRACFDAKLCADAPPINLAEIPDARFGCSKFFDSALWDDVSCLLFRAGDFSGEDVTEPDQVVKAASAVAASVRILLMPFSEHNKLLADLEASLAEQEFLEKRKSALCNIRRTGKRRFENKRVLDSVFDPCIAERDGQIIEALYNTAVEHLSPIVLAPFGMPSSVLGLHMVVNTLRAAGHGHRAAAALCNVWHGADSVGPMVFSERFFWKGSQSTLVIAFSSAGWPPLSLIRPEWGASLGNLVGEDVAIAHAMDTSHSWFVIDPTSGEYDGGHWWDTKIMDLRTRFEHLCLLGDSMGGTAALRFAHHATDRVIAFVPQVNLNDYKPCKRQDLTCDRRDALCAAILKSCAESRARITVHAGRNPCDARQASLLSTCTNVQIIKHRSKSHFLATVLKESGCLEQVLSEGLFGHAA